jgi:hypothetical protein
MIYINIGGSHFMHASYEEGATLWRIIVVADGCYSAGLVLVFKSGAEGPDLFWLFEGGGDGHEI